MTEERFNEISAIVNRIVSDSVGNAGIQETMDRVDMMEDEELKSGRVYGPGGFPDFAGQEMAKYLGVPYDEYVEWILDDRSLTAFNLSTTMPVVDLKTAFADDTVSDEDISAFL